MSLRQTPNRPNNDITQSYNDGIVKIYSASDAAQPGRMPQKSLKLKLILRYSEQRLGINRYYSAKQNQIEVDRVLRVQRIKGITNQDVAQTDDGKYYSIEMVQSTDGIYPPSLDITLSAISQGVKLNVV